MALAHLRATVIGASRSPVASAAYRHRATMMDLSVGIVVSYAHNTDLAHEDRAAR